MDDPLTKWLHFHTDINNTALAGASGDAVKMMEKRLPEVCPGSPDPVQGLKSGKNSSPDRMDVKRSTRRRGESTRGTRRRR
ncbi:hypothetical protein WMY93_001394 [Mugilogobius chulae]|uniref:Uncharacterized protein n=1 Tax=Mugilogobius chulae TaxID=88201 RepID=A0AAW0Q254_9GOBI